MDVTWVRQFLKAVQGIPPHLMFQRLSCTLRSTLLAANDEALLVELLEQALIHCRVKETRLEGGAAWPPCRGLAKQLACNTTRSLYIKELDGQGWVLHGALEGLMQQQQQQEKSSSRQTQPHLRLGIELPATFVQPQVAQALINYCCCSNNNNNTINDNRIGTLFLRFGTAVGPREWQLLTRLLQPSSSRMRSLKVAAFGPPPPPPHDDENAPSLNQRLIRQAIQAAIAANTTLTDLVLYFPLDDDPRMARAVLRGLETNRSIVALKTIARQDDGQVVNQILCNSLPKMQTLQHFTLLAPRPSVARPNEAQTLLAALGRNTSLTQFASPLPDPDIFPYLVRLLERNRLLRQMPTAENQHSVVSPAEVGAYLARLVGRHPETAESPRFHLVREHVLHHLVERQQALPQQLQTETSATLLFASTKHG